MVTVTPWAAVEPFGQGFEPVRPAGDQHEVRAAGGQLARELGAET